MEVMLTTCSVKWNRAINEKDRVIHVVFSRSSAKKLARVHVRSCRFKRCMEQIVRVEIGGGVHPILFIIKLYHRFINRNAIRAPI